MSTPLPPPSHPCWLRLASGPVPASFQTKQLALQLLFKRLQGETTPPSTKARDVYAFFTKYEKILGAEVAQLAHL